MAVEARRMTLLPSSGNGEMIEQGNGNGNVYDNGVPIGYGMPPLSKDMLIPIYGSGIIDSLPPANLKAESGLTCSLPVSRKRSRDSSSFNPLLSLPIPNSPFLNHNQRPTFTFLGEDVSMQVYQQQSEIDRFIAHHTEKVRTEIEEMRKRNSRRLIAMAEEGIMKRLRAKEEEIAKVGKLNWALEEKLKSLSVENQIWRELAQTNEATANVLRSNLEQVLAQVHQQHRGGCTDADDAQSCCGSNYDEDNYQKHQQRTLADDGGEYCSSSSRWCRNCGKGESNVLLLPCRHLCICSVCASSINICPLCKSAKTAGVHINMS